MKGGGHGDLGPLLNHFYVMMEGSFMHKMCIPKKFAETIEGSVSENIELEGPSGDIWHVKMMRSSDTFILQSGWKDFVIANKIDKNDTLVFTYNGDSLFEVLIFDLRGCEKVSPFFAKKAKMDLEESNDSSVRVVSAPYHKVQKETISLSSGSETESATASDVRSAPSARRCMTGERVCCKQNKKDITHESSESDDRGQKPDSKTVEKGSFKNKFSSYIVPHKTHLTKAQGEIADRMARQAQKGSDLFVKILTAMNCEDYRNCVLNLPSGFACNVLRSKKRMVTMLPADFDKSKGYNANYYKRTAVRCIGWGKFVHKNGLKIGDLCLFELRKQEIQGKLVLTMLVHFETKSKKSDNSSVRVGAELHCKVKKEVTSLSSGSDSKFCSNNSSRSARPLKRKRTVFVQESSESDEGNRHVRKTVEKKGPKKKFRSYIVPQGTYLTKAQQEIADRMSRQAQKGSDLFVKILTYFNCEANRKSVLNLPSGFACKVLGSRKQMITILPANLDKSKGYTANYYKISKMRCIGWRKFVHKNRLKEGDLCLFELRKQEIQGNIVLTMLVHFETKSKESDNSSVRVGATLHHKVKTEGISLSSGSYNSSCSAQPLKRKRTDSLEERKHKTFRTRNNNHAKKTSRPYIVPLKTYLTKAQAEIANRITQKTEKGSELFVKILTDINIRASGVLNLPRGFGSEVLGNKKREIILVPADSEKKSRIYVGNYSKNKHGKQIGYGWPKFVRINGLKKGDFCLFELRKEKKQRKLVLTIVVHFNH